MSNLTINHVSKSFGTTLALHKVNLTFEENKIYGLLGRNGAGKTTLLNIINNRIFADEGTVTLDGTLATENSSVQRKFYYMGEKLLYPDSMKVNKAIKWTKEFYPSFDTEYALKLAKAFDLPLKKKINSLTTGDKSIFKNVIALSVNVPFVFLDEPVLGLDANHRELFYKVLIEKYIESPATYVISTHLIEEVANIVENVIIIKSGQIINNDTKENLLSNGYCISGPGTMVDEYIKGKHVIGIDSLGGLKSAYLLGTPDENTDDRLEISGLDLQKLFIRLTNS
ncbi:MAG: ATP-binding cassette domain-containing protein [Suipraeoptans sp.]